MVILLIELTLFRLLKIPVLWCVGLGSEAVQMDEFTRSIMAAELASVLPAGIKAVVVAVEQEQSKPPEFMIGGIYNVYNKLTSKDLGPQMTYVPVRRTTTATAVYQQVYCENAPSPKIVESAGLVFSERMRSEWLRHGGGAGLPGWNTEREIKAPTDLDVFGGAIQHDTRCCLCGGWMRSKELELK